MCDRKNIPVAAQDDVTLADPQRQIIEAAKQRGYARAKLECAQDLEGAKRYRFAAANLVLSGGVPRARE